MKDVVVFDVQSSALFAHESAESNVGVRASVVLAVDAERVKLVLVDYLVEEGCLVSRL